MKCFKGIAKGLSLLFFKRNRIMEPENEELKHIMSGVIESSDNAIFVHRDLKFVYLNEKAVDLIDGGSASNVIGKPVEDFISVNMEVVGEDRMKIVAECGYLEPFKEEVFYKVSGEEIPMEIMISTIVVDGKNYIKVICRNVPEKKKIIELQEKVEIEEQRMRDKIQHEKLRDEFFANLSHELRTPIAIILGSLQLMEKSDGIEEFKDSKTFKSIKKNGYRLLRLVNNMLDITKIDAGQFDIHKTEENIVYVVEDMVGSIADYIKSKDIQIVFDTDVEEKFVYCNVECMDRIVLNLISNSVKFTEQGGKIEVCVRDYNDRVRISVKDNGIGIKDNDQKVIFERFRQVDKSFRRNHEGSGIGLSIVKSLVDMHSGSIEVKSTYGEGTEFIMDFPVAQGHHEYESREITDKEVYINRKVNIEFSDV